MSDTAKHEIRVNIAENLKLVRRNELNLWTLHRESVASIDVFDPNVINLLTEISTANEMALSDVVNYAGSIRESALRITAFQTLVYCGAISFSIWNGGAIICVGNPIGIGQKMPVHFTPPSICRLRKDAFVRFDRSGEPTLQAAGNKLELQIRDKKVGEKLLSISDQRFAPEGSLECSISQILWLCGFVEGGYQDSKFNKFWQFEEKLFHFFSRGHQDFSRRGATFRFGSKPPIDGEFYPHPLAQEPAPQNPSDLPMPKGVDFFQLLKRRRTSRVSGEDLSLQSVLAILNSALCVQRTVQCDMYDYQERPYPSAGGLHELEYYLLVRVDVAGLKAGVYQYDPIALALLKFAEISDQMHILFDDAKLSWSQDSLPRMLLICCGKMPRIAWKYEGISYRLMLLNVGCALQTILLCSSAFGISACPIGVGDSELLSKVLLRDELKECSLLEIAFP